MKKGFSLIETVVALAIASIITAMVSNFYLKYSKSYNINTVSNRNYFYCNEALMFIENEIRNSKSAAVNNNILEVKYPDGIVKKYIKYNGAGSLVIVHTESGTTKAVNNILNNVSGFSVFQKYNTIYVEIIIKGGDRYERCFGINVE